MGEETGVEERVEPEVLAEWTIRRLRPLKEPPEEGYPEKVKRWVLFSLGMDKTHQDIFLHLEENFSSTTTEIAGKFNISPNTARKYLDELHTVGLVDYVGREYTLTYESLSRAIELMLIPRITDTLRTIARGASSADRAPYPFEPEGDEGDEGDEGGEAIVEVGVIEVNRKLLEAWYRRGKKVRIKSYGRLRINEDVDPELLDSVVERIKSLGTLEIPENIYAAISHKIRSLGAVKVY